MEDNVEAGRLSNIQEDEKPVMNGSKSTSAKKLIFEKNIQNGSSEVTSHKDVQVAEDHDEIRM